MKKVLVTGVLALATLGLALVLLVIRGNNTGPADVKSTRALLQREGLKTRLADFNLSVSPEMRVRAEVLTKADFTGKTQPQAFWSSPSDLNLMQFISTDSARVVWTRNDFRTYSGKDAWLGLRLLFAEQKTALDSVSEAVLAGPIGFELASNQGVNLSLPHVSALKTFSQLLAERAMVELHDGNTAAAWNDLLACSRLSLAWNPEPAEISHLTRFSCATIAYNALWQALQTNTWTDAQLVRMQQEWEAADFFGGLPETAAFLRACLVDGCQRERKQPVGSPLDGVTLLHAVRNPNEAWGAVSEYRRRLHYRGHGSYEDEKDLLLHFRARELELRQAVACGSWAEMRLIPEATNATAFTSQYWSSFMALYNSNKALSYRPEASALLGRAAGAETRRRILIAALALARHRLHFGSYPQRLQELQGQQPPATQTDFMDGQPLRYRLTTDGFVLYSVGLDCRDDGAREPADILWPRSASSAEIAANPQDERVSAGLEFAVSAFLRASPGRTTNPALALQMQQFMQSYRQWSSQAQSSTQAQWLTERNGVEEAERINELLMRRYRDRWKRSHNMRAPFTPSLPAAGLGE